ncbi:DNA-binding protein [Pseudomonas cavernae]|uniref:DNA-binding protein n=1 Tax=Pseudomonas cavernae TaxID=2320867 RepID=A0A385Z0X6_9PSED|nr:helix-turn-helix domain-containing protein [Pseudomonas cavernae]AYC32311.1 DNA-binding protein [Pseudomonas cavernae]
MTSKATRNSDTSSNLPIPGAFATSEQLCNRLQISRTTWWRWSKAPGFPAPIRFGRSVRWPTEAIEAFLAKQGV